MSLLALTALVTASLAAAAPVPDFSPSESRALPIPPWMIAGLVVLAGLAVVAIIIGLVWWFRLKRQTAKIVAAAGSDKSASLLEKGLTPLQTQLPEPKENKRRRFGPFSWGGGERSPIRANADPDYCKVRYVYSPGLASPVTPLQARLLAWGGRMSGQWAPLHVPGKGTDEEEVNPGAGYSAIPEVVVHRPSTST